jgi:5-methylcytosine-specific restriction enzyme A
LEIFKRDHYTCQCGCGLLEGDTSLLVCDHKIPHRGDERLFWDEDNLQTLRKSRSQQATRRTAILEPTWRLVLTR